MSGYPHYYFRPSTSFQCQGDESTARGMLTAEADPATSHIPLILLTAKAAEENRIEGLETGADDYLIKPFNFLELVVRTRNLIESRQRLRERFSRDMFLPSTNRLQPSADEKFLQCIMAIVEPHLADADFDVEELGHEIAMSRSQLYRKLYHLTNHSPSDFLRTIRLRRAAELLSAKAGSVSEVAYQVGYKDVSHFSKSFNKQFGVSPSGYLH
jgi:AraC-like DNA-binding protein